MVARAAEYYEFALVFGEMIIMYRRTADRRPYNIVDSLLHKLMFSVLAR